MYDDTLASASFGSAKPGDMLTFGMYPQTADGTDRTPIQWRVLRRSGRELLLLAEYILDCKQYHGEFTETMWRDCDLRRWLNQDFYNAAFSAAEKDSITTTLCSENGDGSPDTHDTVFLLSVSEAKALTAPPRDALVTQRRAIATDYARVKKADGCHLYVYDKSVSEDYITKNGHAYGCSWWWLRTQLGSLSRASFVGPRSSIRSYCRVNRVNYGVRPALKYTFPA